MAAPVTLRVTAARSRTQPATRRGRVALTALSVLISHFSRRPGPLVEPQPPQPSLQGDPLCAPPPPPDREEPGTPAAANHWLPSRVRCGPLALARALSPRNGSGLLRPRPRGAEATSPGLVPQVERRCQDWALAPAWLPGTHAPLLPLAPRRSLSRTPRWLSPAGGALPAPRKGPPSLFLPGSHLLSRR